MIEKAIENWLTSTNERNFQIPYCAVLAKQGHRVLDVSSNRPMEQGKDVTTLDSASRPCAYQLKGGDIDLAMWRKIRPEIEELMQLPIVHPSVDKALGHKAFIVTNGRFTDEVRIQIDQMNEDNVRKGRNYARLEMINGNVLLKDFLDAQGAFMPIELEEIQEFLGFFLADGKDFLDKEKFAKFLEERVFAKGSGQVSNKVNAILASVLMTAYALNNYQQRDNHYAAFEAWTVLSSQIIHFASVNGLKSVDWRPSYNLAMLEVQRSLQLLKDETLSKPDFLEGEGMGDGGEVYRARATIVLGALAAFELHRAVANPQYTVDQRVTQSLVQNIKRLWYWGESAFPFFFSIFRLLEHVGQKDVADPLRHGMFDEFLRVNSPNSKEGLPSYYYSAQEVIENMMGIAEDHLDLENFAGSSYALPNWIAVFVRRQERPFIEQNWRRISKVRVQEFIPDRAVDIFRWHMMEGTNSSRFLNETQSWAELVKASQGVGEMATLVKDFRPLLSFWILVAPHRCSEPVINALDSDSAVLRTSRP